MKDTGLAAGTTGTPTKASTKRAARKSAPAPGERERSPIQALQAAVKKAAGKTRSKKPRR